MNEDQNGALNQTNPNQSPSDQNSNSSQNQQGQPYTSAPHFDNSASAASDKSSAPNFNSGNYDYYNFRDTNSTPYGQPYPPYGAPKPPKKEHPFLKELGKFSLKSLIACLIAGVVFVGALSSARGLGIIEKPDINVSIPKDSGGNGGYGNYGFPGDGSSSGDGNRGSQPDENGENNGKNDESDSDGPKLGISVQSVPEELTGNGYPEGAMIAEVVSGGNADKAGLKVGDIITSFNGSAVKSADDLVSLVSDVKKGDTVKVVYKRMVDSQLKAMDADITFADTESSSTS